MATRAGFTLLISKRSKKVSEFILSFIAAKAALSDYTIERIINCIKQNMETVIIVLILLNIVLVFFFRSKPNTSNQETSLKIDSLEKSLQRIESNFKDDFRINREENSNTAKDNRIELNNTLKHF